MRPASLLAVLGAAVLLTACGAAGSGAPLPAASAGPGENAPTYTIGESYATVTHECTTQQTVRITGSTNIIELVEPCRQVVVVGSTNQVVIQTTGTLRIGGRNQHITVQKVTSGVVQLGGADNQLVCGSRISINDTGTGNQTAGCGG
ncbi:MAG: hypothetical protein ACREQM_06235 [Candidatus Dormibacteraceae bacterium]